MFVPRIELAERNEKTLCQGAHSVAEFVKHTSRQVESKLEIQVSEGGREHAKEKTEPTKYPLQIEDAGSEQVDRANKTKFQSYEGTVKEGTTVLKGAKATKAMMATRRKRVNLQLVFTTCKSRGPVTLSTTELFENYLSTRKRSRVVCVEHDWEQSRKHPKGPADIVVKDIWVAKDEGQLEEQTSSCLHSKPKPELTPILGTSSTAVNSASNDSTTFEPSHRPDRTEVGPDDGQDEGQRASMHGPSSSGSAKSSLESSLEQIEDPEREEKRAQRRWERAIFRDGIQCLQDERVYLQCRRRRAARVREEESSTQPGETEDNYRCGALPGTVWGAMEESPRACSSRSSAQEVWVIEYVAVEGETPADVVARVGGARAGVDEVVSWHGAGFEELEATKTLAQGAILRIVLRRARCAREEEEEELALVDPDLEFEALMEEIPAPDDLCFGEEEGFLLLEGDEDEDEDEEKASQDTVEMGGGGAKPKSAESSPDARSSPEKETACQCAGTEEDAEEAAEDSLKQNRATRGEEDSVDEEDGQQRKPEGFCAPTTPSAVDASSCAPSALSFVGAAAWGHAAHGSKQARWKPGCGRPPPAPLPHPSIPPPDLVIPPFPQDDSELPPPCGASREEGEKARDRPDAQASATSKVPEPGVRLASARAEEHDSGVALEREIEAAPPAVTAASLCAAPLSGAEAQDAWVAAVLKLEEEKEEEEESSAECRSAGGS